MARKSLASPAVADQQQQAQFLQLLLLAGMLGNGHQTREEGRKRGEDKRYGRRREQLTMQQLYLKQLGLQQHYLQQQFLLHLYLQHPRYQQRLYKKLMCQQLL